MNDTNNMGSGPNYGKFVVDNSATMGEGRYETPLGPDASKGRDFGQVKYAKRGVAESIYRDETRDTQNDKDAQARSAGMGCGDDDGDETQDGMY